MVLHEQFTLTHKSENDLLKPQSVGPNMDMENFSNKSAADPQLLCPVELKI